jgi:uncharacterized protein (DUF1778 family)
MAYVAQLLSARVLTQLNDEQLARIISIVDGEILQNASLKKAVTAKVDEALKELKGAPNTKRK